MALPDQPKRHFIQQIIESDCQSGQHTKPVLRFPPEPNGYLHIGHAKSICLNFGLAEAYQSVCHLRFDDTNPCREEAEYVNAITEDVTWLGYSWGKHLYHASDYYEAFYQAAIGLIQQGLAYVDSLSMDEIRAQRGTLTTPGTESPYRSRGVAENLALFSEMRAGKYREGEHVLRAKIDMASGNINLRDPVIYRIRFEHHQRTGDAWCIYPMYDFAHPLSDAYEGITHSLCTLEFQDHRPLYDWIITHCAVPSKPQQIEFARLNVSHTLTSKRKLRTLVETGEVAGWDDPRLPTLVGLRRRGFPPQAIRRFCDLVGVTKSDSLIDMGLLEECVRDELNQTAPRAMTVLRPLKIILRNYPKDRVEWLTAQNHPQDHQLGARQIPFTRELYIEREDFLTDPPKKFYRLAPGKEVRLRHAYIIRAQEIEYDANGEIAAILCDYDDATLGTNPTDRKVKGVLHWVAADFAQPAEVHLYDRLCQVANPAADAKLSEILNPHSHEVITNALVEPRLNQASPGEVFQFERLGYFVRDTHAQALVFNRTIALKDSWAKIR